jgi:Ca2+/H+ antiporter, TMEM165/GDT1 family
MHATLVSTLTVAIAEIGDKTQFMALLLASRFRQPLPIIAGIVVATSLNHALAGLLGGIAAAAIDPTMLRWLLGLVFIAWPAGRWSRISSMRARSASMPRAAPSSAR